MMGTAVYMSPEQARGLPVDARTDIFSLGVVLYEMIAGRLPFEGSNRNEIMASVLSDKDPPPLARYAREVPSELERIVAKALHKEREQRYQTIKDMLLDLKSLKQHLEFKVELERSQPPEIANDQAEPGAARATVSLEALQTATVTESPMAKIKHHKRLVMIALVVLLVAAASFAYLLRSSRSAGSKKKSSPRSSPYNSRHQFDSRLATDEREQ